MYEKILFSLWKKQTVSVELADGAGKSQTVSGFFEKQERKSQPLADQLSWSHYCYLLSIENDEERSFYEKECINSCWSVRELKRQIDSCLFERLLLFNHVFTSTILITYLIRIL